MGIGNAGVGHGSIGILGVLHGCTDKLPARLREVFVLWHLDDTPGDEICETVAITPTNLWVMLHRARLRMWQCLSKNWYGLDH